MDPIKGYDEWKTRMPKEAEPCEVCKGTGVVPETSTPDSYGVACPNGCKVIR